MAYLRSKSVGGKEYYYLVHSYREEGKHKKIEQYVGAKEPTDEELENQKIGVLYTQWKKKLLTISEDEFLTIEKSRDQKRELTDEQLMDFCVNFTYNTNAIEGSELSHHETKELLVSEKSSNKPFKDQMESFSHKKVFMEMVETKKPLSLPLIKRWHKHLFSHSKPHYAGKFRENNVRVANYKAPHYQDIPVLLYEFVHWYKTERKNYHPVELAALVHLKFVKIHPFGDGNGRIGRLLLNYVLHMHGYPMITIEYSNRIHYYHALDTFDETQNEEVFVQYVVDCYLRECK